MMNSLGKKIKEYKPHQRNRKSHERNRTHRGEPKFATKEKAKTKIRKPNYQLNKSSINGLNSRIKDTEERIGRRQNNRKTK